MKRYVIIVAGGKGLRMGGAVPKQFALLKGKPVLMHTVEAFHRFDAGIEVVLVLPHDQHDYWKSLCAEYDFRIPHKVADGGETRFHSVRNGLALIEGEDGLVGIHDGVRPFVSSQVIEACYSAAIDKEAVVPVVDVVETVRHITEDGSETVPRDRYKLVQTPQVFSVVLLKRAYCQDYVSQFTDDASVVESIGVKVHLVAGNRENIKLTTPFDMKLAHILTEGF